MGIASHRSSNSLNDLGIAPAAAKQLPPSQLQRARLYAEEARGAFVSASQHKAALNESTGDVFDSSQLLREANKHETTIPAIQEKIDDAARAALLRYNWRNRLLLIGFVTLVVARALPAYLH